MSRPQLWIVAGPNGAGKTTMTGMMKQRLRRVLPVVNPDSIASTLSDNVSGLSAVRIQAGRLAMAQRQSRLSRQESFAVETTLSGHSERRLIGQARQAGYKVTLVYIGLRSPDLSMARVALRYSAGGHKYPRRRYHAALP